MKSKANIHTRLFGSFLALGLSTVSGCVAPQTLAQSQAQTPSQAGPPGYSAPQGSSAQPGEPWHPLRELARVWDSVEMGTTPEQTIKLIGLPPLTFETSVNLGLTISTLTWKDACGGSWTAHYVFNRLARKTTSRGA